MCSRDSETYLKAFDSSGLVTCVSPITVLGEFDSVLTIGSRKHT